MDDVTLKELVRSISGADDNGRSLNEILRIVRTAGRLDVVETMLANSDKHTCVAGLWLAAELGATALPLLRTVCSCACEDANEARPLILTCVLSCAAATDGDLIAKSLAWIADS